MNDFEDFVEKVREGNPIEDVIQAFGYPLRLRGNRADGDRSDCNSLHVILSMQHAWWYSQSGWHGDVFAFVMRERKGDFMDALEYLADRAGLRMPQFKKEDASEVQRRAATTGAFTVAAGVFHRWLMGASRDDKDLGIHTPADEDALKYVRGRGWTDESTQKALTGFSGRKQDWQFEDMRGEFAKYGIDPLSPEAVAVLGFKGDVAAWATNYKVIDHPEFERDWIANGKISGLMSAPGIIYTHQRFGKVEYLSRRQLPGFDVIIDVKTNKERAWKSYNPHKCLAGPKQVYYNFAFTATGLCVMVEGQGDAKTYAQWGVGGLALLGAFADFERKTPEEQEVVLRWVKKMWKRDGLYYAPDDDEAGEKNLKVIGKMFGPKIQIVKMPRLIARDENNEVIHV